MSEAGPPGPDASAQPGAAQAPAPDAALQAPRSPGEIFGVFTRLALQGFGGVLPVAQRTLVERQRWLSRAGFLEMMSVAQVLPGPNIVNLALMFGDRHFGGRGAAAALAGILLAPLVCVLGLTILAAHLQDVPAVTGGLRGMGAVAAGLVLSTAIKLMAGLRGHPLRRTGCAAFIGGTAVAVGLLHWPLVWVVLGLGLVAVGLTWWRLAR